MFTYRQSTGCLSRDGVFIAFGHAGQGEGRNNPAAQDQHNIGPLPRGRYKIGAWQDQHPHLGPCVAPLIPQPSSESPGGVNGSGNFDWLCGRGGFFIHGGAFLPDGSEDPRDSEGCIVLNAPVRKEMRESGDVDLTVIE